MWKEASNRKHMQMQVLTQKYNENLEGFLGIHWA